MGYTTMMLRAALLIPVLLVLLALPYSAGAAAPLHYQHLFYYRDSPANKKDFFAHANVVDIFAPQVYSLYPDGTLGGALSQDLITFAKKRGIKIIPLVTNGAFNASTTDTLLTDTAKQSVAITTLIQEALAHGYAGWQFDFEQIPAYNKDAYSAFIQNAATKLRAAGLSVSVAVVAKVSDNPSDYKGRLWQNLIGAYDYDALASSTDFVSLMSYDDPESTGPVVEFTWLKRALDYALLHIPAKKLSLGIPLYYWKWNDVTGKLIDIGGYPALAKTFAKHPNAPYYYDTTYQAPSIYYQDNGVPYTIWYENARSIAAKMALVKSHKLHGASFWALGLENPSVFKSLAR